MLDGFFYTLTLLCHKNPGNLLRVADHASTYTKNLRQIQCILLGTYPLRTSKGIMKYFYTGRSVIIGCSDGGSSQPTLLWSTVLLQPC